MNTTIRCALLTLTLLSTISPSALAISYTATLLPIPAGFDEADARSGDGEFQVGRLGAGSAVCCFAHAVLWGPSTTVDLNPAGFTNSFAVDVLAGHQVGWGSGPTTGSIDHAMLWSGSAATAIDLTPPGYGTTAAYGVSETNQVGWGFVLPNGDQALLWSGTPESAVNLNPQDAIQSRAYAVSGNSQVGYLVLGLGTHAALWHGTANSIVDLNPAAFSDSYAYAVDGDAQGGNGKTLAGGQTHALLWHGSAASAVDLNPSGFQFSNVEDISGNTQVGFGNVNGNVGGGPTDHALLWNGTANSYVDLQQYLPNSGVNFTGSQAFSIAANGEIVGNAFDAAGAYYAVKWTPVPEPGAAALCIAVAMVISVFHRRPTLPPRLT